MSQLPARYKEETEGQFLERKSCFNRRTKTPKPLPLKKVSSEIAETLVAFANADGGELAVGLDDDGTPSGLPYTEKQISRLIDIPTQRIRPELSARHALYKTGRASVLVFEVGSSAVSQRTTAGKYLYRRNDQNVPMDAEHIIHLKSLKRETLTEHAFVPDATLDDLREDLIQVVSRKLGPGFSPKETLIRLHLAEASNGHTRLTFAAMLLFAKDPERWHPKSHVEYLRFSGTSRGHGTELNIVGRQSIIAPLVDLPQRVLEAVRPHIGQRQVLHDLFFTERAEYPQYAWEEAVVNAVAHRDYALRGTPVEIHHYDDRLEVVSPGTIVPPMSLETLRRGGGGHASRNPLIVRVMILIGLMKEIGEGVPRMFSEMAKSGLKVPEFNERPEGCLTVTLRKTLIWDEDTRAWFSQYKERQLSPNQMRLLVMAKQQGGKFSSAQYQKLAELDLYTASQDIKDLIRKGIVRLERKRGRVYVLFTGTEAAMPEDFKSLAAELASKKRLSNEDLRRIWEADRQSALRRARQLVDSGWLQARGQRRWLRYVAGPKVG